MIFPGYFECDPVDSSAIPCSRSCGFGKFLKTGIWLINAPATLKDVTCKSTLHHLVDYILSPFVTQLTKILLIYGYRLFCILIDECLYFLQCRA